MKKIYALTKYYPEKTINTVGKICKI